MEKITKKTEETYTIKNWWTHLVVGILFIIGGFWVLKTPMASYLALSVFFSVMMFVSGISGISFALSNKNKIHGWGWHLAGGIIDFILGIILIIYPQITMIILPILFAFWVMFRGFWAIGVAIELQKFKVRYWWISLILGILSLILSFILIDNPLFAGISIIFLTAFTFFSFGLTQIFLAFDLRSLSTVLKA
ncbi:HdeD family acid-resistance protein [Candidatus Nitrosacidococcus tergens]|uniref:HdeD family acid-resistance protein n=1 Tax=Candidatus Nitrosacidococcus tergens TaxID=553981 RepID=A0A7G1QAQ1_9GAMM|nr:DUF308 domain-containing protein [Candidatus Nitrosacidococcus tergens]CAB1276172.1 conserved membrane protein of unknown function [Candidatus Nitrosacidococcus tergens]